MYINTTGYYIPKQRIPNSYYTEKTGLTDDWIVQRTGIHTRSLALRLMKTSTRWGSRPSTTPCPVSPTTSAR